MCLFSAFRRSSRASSSRSLPETRRDLFDARRTLSLEGLDWAAIKAGFLAFRRLRAPRLVSGVDRSDLRRFARALTETLDLLAPQLFRRRPAVESWIDETFALCRERLAFLFDWAAEEKEFFDSLLDCGEVNAHRLAAPPEIRERIAAMPM